MRCFQPSIHCGGCLPSSPTGPSGLARARKALQQPVRERARSRTRPWRRPCSRHSRLSCQFPLHDMIYDAIRALCCWVILLDRKEARLDQWALTALTLRPFRPPWSGQQADVTQNCVNHSFPVLESVRRDWKTLGTCFPDLETQLSARTPSCSAFTGFHTGFNPSNEQHACFFLLEPSCYTTEHRGDLLEPRSLRHHGQEAAFSQHLHLLYHCSLITTRMPQ